MYFMIWYRILSVNRREKCLHPETPQISMSVLCDSALRGIFFSETFPKLRFSLLFWEKKNTSYYTHNKEIP